MPKSISLGEFTYVISIHKDMYVNSIYVD